MSVPTPADVRHLHEAAQPSPVTVRELREASTAPVAAHVHGLFRSGMTAREIATAANADLAIVKRMIYSQWDDGLVSAQVAARLMAVGG